MKSISEVIKEKSIKPDRHNSKEFQAYGNMLAEELGDIKHRALYIKMAKTENRGLVEAARSYVKDANNATTKGRLFMWKLSQLKKEKGLKACDK
jgi:hypothetical protein